MYSGNMTSYQRAHNSSTLTHTQHFTDFSSCAQRVKTCVDNLPSYPYFYILLTCKTLTCINLMTIKLYKTSPVSLPYRLIIRVSIYLPPWPAKTLPWAASMMPCFKDWGSTMTTPIEVCGPAAPCGRHYGETAWQHTFLTQTIGVSVQILHLF